MEGEIEREDVGEMQNEKGRNRIDQMRGGECSYVEIIEECTCVNAEG